MHIDNSWIHQNGVLCWLLQILGILCLGVWYHGFWNLFNFYTNWNKGGIVMNPYWWFMDVEKWGFILAFKDHYFGNNSLEDSTFLYCISLNWHFYLPFLVLASKYHYFGVRTFFHMIKVRFCEKVSRALYKNLCSCRPLILQELWVILKHCLKEIQFFP